MAYLAARSASESDFLPVGALFVSYFGMFVWYKRCFYSLPDGLQGLTVAIIILAILAVIFVRDTLNRRSYASPWTWSVFFGVLAWAVGICLILVLLGYFAFSTYTWLGVGEWRNSLEGTYVFHTQLLVGDQVLGRDLHLKYTFRPDGTLYYDGIGTWTGTYTVNGGVVDIIHNKLVERLRIEGDALVNISDEGSHRRFVKEKANRAKKEETARQKDPVFQMKQNVAHISTYYLETNGYTIDKCTYDVQKTDSLVSPYVGYVNYTISSAGIVENTKASLAFQDGQWVLQKVQQQHFDLEDGHAVYGSAWEDISPDDEHFVHVKCALGLCDRNPDE